jgi:kinesin light chain
MQSSILFSLEKLEVGVAESGVMLALAGHFDKLEADRSLARLEMRRMQVSASSFIPLKFVNAVYNVLLILEDENEWLREELEDTERRLEDALARLAQMEEEKQHWLFMEEASHFFYFIFNPIFHTWFRDRCFKCDGSSTIQVFPLLFKIGMVN